MEIRHVGAIGKVRLFDDDMSRKSDDRNVSGISPCENLATSKLPLEYAF
jgi:hypothetical protein